jgi:hypothetical protein
MCCRLKRVPSPGFRKIKIAAQYVVVRQQSSLT